jgi:hypothetical protein
MERHATVLHHRRPKIAVIMMSPPPIMTARTHKSWKLGRRDVVDCPIATIYV